jgi:hypothetical protein
MNPNNSDRVYDDIIDFGGGVPMQDFHGWWNPGLHPSVHSYPYFHGGWIAALNKGFIQFPIAPSSPAAPSQNEPFPTMVETAEPTVMKESHGDGEGGSTPASRRRKVIPSRRKLGNFSPTEDVFLVKSWLEISCDPVTNKGQKKEAFWVRIVSQYNKKRATYPEKTLKSLQSRWETIKVKASKFAGYMTNVLRDNPSGMSDVDKVKYYVYDRTILFLTKSDLLFSFALN